MSGRLLLLWPTKIAGVEAEMRILATTRALDAEPVEVHRFQNIDAQGLPTYGSPVEALANVLERDITSRKGGREQVIAPDGSAIMTPLTLYFVGDEPVIPNEGDRIELTDGRRFIAAEVAPYRGLRYRRDQIDHVRVRCRKERA